MLLGRFRHWQLHWPRQLCWSSLGCYWWSGSSYSQHRPFWWEGSLGGKDLKGGRVSAWWENCGISITGEDQEKWCSGLTWGSTNEHRLSLICGVGIQSSHHVVDLRVHIQLDDVGISDHCDEARQNDRIKLTEIPELTFLNRNCHHTTAAYKKRVEQIVQYYSCEMKKRM